MTTTCFWKSSYHILIDDLDNGSAVIYFVANSNGRAFAAIYCDDYDHANGRQWIDLKADIKTLSGTIAACKSELDDWYNGWNDQSPTVRAEFWDY